MYSDKKTAMKSLRSMGRNFPDSRGDGQARLEAAWIIEEPFPRWFLREAFPLEYAAPFRWRVNPQRPDKESPWSHRAEIRWPSPCRPCGFAASPRRQASVPAASGQLFAALLHHSRLV